MAVQHPSSAEVDGGTGLRVELSVGQAVPVDDVRTALGAGRAVTVVLADAPIGTTADDPAVGWEIGVLTVLAGLGVTDVQGADPVRARRVLAVVDELDRTAADQGSGS